MVLAPLSAWLLDVFQTQTASGAVEKGVSATMIALDEIEAGNFAEIDDTAWRSESFLHEINHVDPACLQDRSSGGIAPHQIGHCGRSGISRLSDRFRSDPIDRLHSDQSKLGIFPRVAKMVAGFIGKERTRNPIAL